MNDDPLSPKRILLAIIIALIIVFAGTMLLNGGTSTEVEDNNITDEVVNDTADIVHANSTLIGNNSMGTVSKMGTYGNNSSNMRIAFIVGVDEADVSNNSIIPIFENEKDLNYAYDIYIVNATSNSNGNDTSNNSNDLSVKNKTEMLAKEYVVPEVISKKYNCTVDVHRTEDSNSYVYVPSDNTYTSKYLVRQISQTTSVGQYTPPQASYIEAVSQPILESDIASIVYVTRDFNTNTLSNEINEIIQAVDSFNFEDVSVYVETNDNSDTDSSQSNEEVSTESQDSFSNDNGTVRRSSGNREVD